MKPSQQLLCRVHVHISSDRLNDNEMVLTDLSMMVTVGATRVAETAAAAISPASNSHIRVLLVKINDGGSLCAWCCMSMIMFR